uniref:Uncharacterized protein n=1 Tax=Electrophorus electricus TaxID=8005 RepID=A0A4W4EAH9_ELEEL
VQRHQQGRRGHRDQLQCPQAYLRDGEESVEADVLTARLLRVAHKLLLLVLPHLLSGGGKDEDAEHEEDREPDSPDDGGVLVYATQHSLQKAPVHDCQRDN